METNSPQNEQELSFVKGVETLCETDSTEAKKDLTLCYICLQWTCDGPHCHRDDVCDVTPPPNVEQIR